MKLFGLAAVLVFTVFMAPPSARAGEFIKKKWYDADGKVVEQWVYSGRDSKRAYQLARSSHRARPYRGRDYHHGSWPLAYRSAYTIYPSSVYYRGGSYYPCRTSRAVGRVYRAPVCRGYHGAPLGRGAGTSLTVFGSGGRTSVLIRR